MKSVLVHGALALLGLAFAYQTWTRPAQEETAPQQTGAVVLQCKPETLRSIKLETPTHFVDIVPVHGAGEAGEAYWITTRRKSKAEQAADEAKTAKSKGAAAAGAAGAAGTAGAAGAAGSAADDQGDDADKAHADDEADKPADGQPADASAKPKKTLDPTQPKRFLANATFKDYLKRMTPLLAARELGTLPKDQLADFGFDNVGTRLTLDCAGKTVTLESGTRTYGTGQRYLRDEKTKIAYLFDDALVADLTSAQFRFMQNEVHAFQLADVDEAKVTARGATKRLLHRERKLTDRATWVDAAQPTKRNELYDNWFSRLSKLRVREYLDDGAEPGAELGNAAGAATPVATIEYVTDGKPKGKLELLRVDEGPTAHYYARTETTRSWVSVFEGNAKDVENDVGMIVGLEEAPAPTAAKPNAGDATKGSTLPPGHPALP